MSEEKEPTRQLNFTLTYPHSDEYEFLTKIEIIDLDAEARKDIASGNGFIISAPKNSNKKDMKSIDGIYSSRFGQKLGDVSPYADRYSCECGHLKSRINHDMECPICHTKVQYVDDNFKMFGWIILNEKYHIIHPKFYDSLDYIMGESKYNHERKKMNKGGRKLDNILFYNPEVDQNGFTHECEFKPDKEPFYGIGMIEFYNRFDEILDYYYGLNPKKKEYFDEIKAHRDIVFTHSIPVFTTHLRPADIKDGYMYYEPTNGMYNMINKHVHIVNNDKRRINRDEKVKAAELYKIQIKYQELVEEIFSVLSGKKGTLRSLVGGRSFGPYTTLIVV